MVNSAIDIQPIVSDIVDTFRPQYPQVEFDLKLQDLMAMGTQKAIRIIIEELVENAIVHNPSGTPEVSITVSNNDEGDVLVSIADNGPGIPEMERMVFAKGEEDSLLHSNGIGLWTVNWLTTRLDGRGSIVDTPEGTRVEVTFPTAGETR